MKDLNLAIVDVETTGLSPHYERVIEIGLLVIEKGKLIDKFTSLINPERTLPSFITALTGIEDKELKRAPTFKSIQKRIHKLFQNRIFVAHNAHFDYGFLQSEFQRSGLHFSPKRLCTVRLSRRLFPKERGHGLDKIIHRFGFKCRARHRALEDAEILWKFLKEVQSSFSKDEIRDTIDGLLK